MRSEANKAQMGGTHYRSTYQHWDFVAKVLEDRYMEGNITKYLTRSRKKNGIQDLDKALHYLDKLIEMAESDQIRPLAGVADDLTIAWKEIGTFCAANNLSLTETAIVNAVATWSTIMELRNARNAIKRMIRKEHGEEDAGPGYVDQG